MVIEILKEHGEPMWIMDLHAHFVPVVRHCVGLHIALHNMQDAREISIAGGGHKGARKMITLLNPVELPLMSNARIVRFSDDWKPDTGLTNHTFGLQSSMVNLINLAGE